VTVAEPLEAPLDELEPDCTLAGWSAVVGVVAAVLAVVDFAVVDLAVVDFAVVDFAVVDLVPAVDFAADAVFAAAPLCAAARPANRPVPVSAPARPQLVIRRMRRSPASRSRRERSRRVVVMATMVGSRLGSPLAIR
jgi:hypothetical protein